MTVKTSTETTVVNVHGPSRENFVYIGRVDRTDKHFGNPFTIGKDGNREQVINKFRIWLLAGKPFKYDKQRQFILANMEKLRGRKLGCFCFPRSCHGDVYIDVLNMSEHERQMMEWGCPECDGVIELYDTDPDGRKGKYRCLECERDTTWAVGEAQSIVDVIRSMKDESS